MTAAGAIPQIVAPRGGTLATADGGDIPVDFSLLTVGSVPFDAVFVPGGAESTKALAPRRSRPTAARSCPGGAAGIDDALGAGPEFMKAIAGHREWGREERAQQIPV